MNTQTRQEWVELRKEQIEVSKNAKHSAKTVEHYTPKRYIEAVHQVLGNISLDPASNAIANETVQACRYYTAYDDGLTRRWSGNIFCNPPGGKVQNKSRPKLFWNKLMDELKYGNINHAIFLAFSIEALQTCQKGVIRPMGSFPICFPDHRISFVNAEGRPVSECCPENNDGTLIPNRSPIIPADTSKNVPSLFLAKAPKGNTHASCFVYVPGQYDRSDYFAEVFSQFGSVLKPY